MKSLHKIRKNLFEKRGLSDVVVFEGITTFSVDEALSIIFLKVKSTTPQKNTVGGMLIGDSDCRNESIRITVREQFLAFCRDQKISPIHISDPEQIYQGDESEGGAFTISFSEFEVLLRGYGVKLSRYRKPAFLPQSSREEKPDANVKITPRSNDSEFSDDPDDGWDPEIVEAVKNEMQRKKLKKLNFQVENIPGKMPHTRMGKLAVQIAWEHEVFTREAASPADVMKKLRLLALQDDDAKPEYLGSPITDLGGKEAVQFLVHDQAKPYRLKSLSRDLLNWKKSYHKK